MTDSTKRVFLLILFSVILASAGQLLTKSGMTAVGKIELLQLLSPTSSRVVLNPLIILGLSLYPIASLIWLVVLSRAELSYAYPLVGMGYIITSIIAWVLFKENMTLFRFLGITLIVAGVYLISLKK